MKYRASNTDSFWEIEMVQVAKNISGKNIENLTSYIKSEKFIDYKSDSNLLTKALGLNKRFQMLDSFLIEELSSCDAATKRFLIIYSIYSNERLMYDFLSEVIYTNVLKLKNYITKEEIRNFMIDKGRQVEIVNNWTPSTKDRMEDKLVEYFIKGGYLIRNSDDFSIIFPSIDPRVKKYIEENSVLDIKTIFLER